MDSVAKEYEAGQVSHFIKGSIFRKSPPRGYGAKVTLPFPYVNLSRPKTRNPLVWEPLENREFTSCKTVDTKCHTRTNVTLRKNVKTLRQPGSSQASHSAQVEVSRKVRRSEIHLANRDISSEAVVSPSIPSSTTGSVANELTTTMDHRKKILNKWKQETTDIPIFKTGETVAIPLSVPVSRQKPGGVKILPVQPPVVERRVARQMAKATSGPVSTTTATTIGNNNKPISSPMKHLTISNKNNSGGTSMNGVGGLVARVPSVKKPSQVENKAPIGQRGVTTKATLNNVPTVDLNNNRSCGFSSVELVKVMVATAIRRLEVFSEYWGPLLDNTPGIPKPIRDEIISSLGKLQLLLGSKLPQFDVLLHLYMSTEVSPFPILESDLQGWWDVAVIQVNQVCSSFKKLKELEANQWTQQEEGNGRISVKTERASE